ncbi:uncharacterized protein K444DRAFT_631453 [Hyaloscypha bicolor E]|uniref:WSC domain-containing protein n=1 Tax=Hyaloscypha bicolor E TaxID=1095630 RepID=A0A2J6T4N0_9HELO|nr:uncharacterized protein K444DRAFT_631453 [Hyaloscypha bicolor E]PMD57975.1 hypothetical protein K444DRAFT_631453 [Hyaloscypha bicolor E]
MEHILNGGASAVRQAPSTTCLGCYEETTTGPRTLAGAAFFNYTAVTPEMCGAPSSAYVYYGIVCGGECYCGNIIAPAANGAIIAPSPADCSMPCPGNAAEEKTE